MTKKERQKEVIKQLDLMIAQIEQMPPEAMIASLNHYDLLSLLYLFSSFFKS